MLFFSFYSVTRLFDALECSETVELSSILGDNIVIVFDLLDFGLMNTFSKLYYVLLISSDLDFDLNFNIDLTLTFVFHRTLTLYRHVTDIK